MNKKRTSPDRVTVILMALVILLLSIGMVDLQLRKSFTYEVLQVVNVERQTGDDELQVTLRKQNGEEVNFFVEEAYPKIFFLSFGDNPEFILRYNRDQFLVKLPVSHGIIPPQRQVHFNHMEVGKLPDTTWFSVHETRFWMHWGTFSN